jgi:hypothetical protein
MVTYNDLCRYVTERLAGSWSNCDKTLKLSQEFAERLGLSVDDLLKVLAAYHVSCDCEVMMMGPHRIPGQEVIGQETFDLSAIEVTFGRGSFCHCCSPKTRSPEEPIDGEDRQAGSSDLAL